MAITVNGFGVGSGGGGALRGDCYMKVINAKGNIILDNIKDPSNYTPSVDKMQELLNVQGPGRLLLLAPFGNYEYPSTAPPIRLRVDADDRTIYKTCSCSRIIERYSSTGDESFIYFATGDSLPVALIDNLFFNNDFQDSGDTHVYPLDVRLSLRTDKYFPGKKFGNKASVNDRYVTIVLNYRTDVLKANNEIGFDFHNREDDNRLGVEDYWISLFPGGLFFDDNLIIHAAYGYTGNSDFKNGILAIYQLFDE